MKRALLLVLGMLGGCAHEGVSLERLQSLDRNLAQVLSAGAYACAPRELALARAHLEFARVELAQGDPESALTHIREADVNAGAAAILSPRSPCAGQRLEDETNAAALGGPDEDGDGIASPSDRCPDQPEDPDGFLDRDGCPDPDNDADGIPDLRDRCPDEQEDVDGHEDLDGCRDSDNDADGLDDQADDCPEVAGVKEARGCPSYPRVRVTGDRLWLAEPVLLGGPQEGLPQATAGLLDEVAQVLLDRPRLTLEVQGHTDSQGEEEANLLWSQEQAEAVRVYLVRKGVPATRLTARGYGETRPIESNRTSQGRAMNRRVEFKRTDGGP